MELSANNTNNPNETFTRFCSDLIRVIRGFILRGFILPVAAESDSAAYQIPKQDRPRGCLSPAGLVSVPKGYQGLRDPVDH